MLPNAVLPPSLDHNYAQWQEREENSHTEQPPLMKKIIPAPKPKGPGEPDSPTPLLPPTPPILSKAPDEVISQFSLDANIDFVNLNLIYLHIGKIFRSSLNVIKLLFLLHLEC